MLRHSPSASGTTVEAIRQINSSLTVEWDELAGSVGASPWSRPGWLDIWLRSFGGGPPVVFCCREGGELTGVLPMLENHGRLSAPVNEQTPAFEPLAVNGAVAQKLWQAAFEHSSGVVSVLKVPSSTNVLQPLCLAAGQARRRVVQRGVHSSPYLDINGDWKTYEASLSASWRQSLRRRRRQLERAGRLDVEVSDGADRFEELFDEGLRIEPSGWKREAGSALIDDAQARGFYEAMAKWAAAQGWLRLVFLRLDGRAIAFRLDLETGGTYYHLKGGYDPDFAAASPGNVVAAAVLEDAFNRRLKRFEFLGASEPHKLRWTRTTRELQLIRAFDRSLSGRAGYVFYKHVRPLVARVRRR